MMKYFLRDADKNDRREFSGGTKEAAFRELVRLVGFSSLDLRRDWSWWTARGWSVVVVG